MAAYRFPAVVVVTIMREADLSASGLANELAVAPESVRRWLRREELCLDAVVKLLKFAIHRKLPSTTRTLTGYLQKAVGPGVDVKAK